MNKIFLLAVVLLVVFTGCATDDEYVAKDMRVKMNCRTRSIDEAADFAENAISMLDSKETRSGCLRVLDRHKAVKCITNRNSRSSAIDTLMYVFNYENNAGFSVISAVPCTEPVLMVAEEGNYDPEVKSFVEGFDLYVDRLKSYLSGIVFPPGGITIEDRDTVLTGRMKPINDTIVRQLPAQINLRWGQDNPYGNLCPNGISGCVNTAIGMIMAHFHAPATMTFNFDKAHAGTRQIDWNLVNQHIGTNYCYDYNHQGDSIIACIMRQLGYENRSTYYTNGIGTSTVSSMALDNLTNIHGLTHTPQMRYDSGDNYKAMLDAGNICYVSGREENAAMGHAFILDGYKDLIHRFYNCNVYNIISNGRVVGEYLEPVSGGESPVAEYWHINWGGDGWSNGYYYKGVFCVGELQEADPGVPHDGNNRHDYGYSVFFSFIHD